MHDLNKREARELQNCRWKKNEATTHFDCIAADCCCSFALLLYYHITACLILQVQNYKMGQVFGKEKPLKEVMRENKRMITRAVRELDREKMALEREEKRITMEIKKAAKEGQMQSVKIMAKVRMFVLWSIGIAMGDRSFQPQRQMMF